MRKKAKKMMGQKEKLLLTLRERTIIEIRYREGKTITAIAKKVGKDKGTISREIDGKPRKGRGAYNADRAHMAALKRIEKRGNTSVLEKRKELKKYVIEKLKLSWSPE
jgi:transposase, IS30 family